MKGGEEQGGYPELEQQQAEWRIREGIEAAEREQRLIDHRTARRIAEHVHVGTGSALWLLATTGEIRIDEDDEDIHKVDTLFDELWACSRVLPNSQLPWLGALASYALHREEDSRPIRGWQRLTGEPEDEPRSMSSPRIYVVSLADFRNARDHGAWIDADQDPDEILAEVDAMLASSIVPGATKWAIHDYEGFGELDVADFEGLEEVSAVALGISEHGLAFAAYAGWAGTSTEALAGFVDSYEGHWPSVRAYAEHFAEEVGWPETLDRVVPEGMRRYVDINYARLCEDTENEMHVVEGEDGVYVFLNI